MKKRNSGNAKEEPHRKCQRGGLHWNKKTEKDLIAIALVSDPVVCKSFVTSVRLAVLWDPVWTAKASNNLPLFELRQRTAACFGVPIGKVSLRERRFLLTVGYEFIPDHEVFARLGVQEWCKTFSNFSAMQRGVDLNSLDVTLLNGKVTFTVQIRGRHMRETVARFLASNTVFDWSSGTRSVSLELKSHYNLELLVECVVGHEKKLVEFVGEKACLDELSCTVPGEKVLKVRLFPRAGRASCIGRVSLRAWGSDCVVCRLCASGAMAPWTWHSHALTDSHRHLEEKEGSSTTSALGTFFP